MTVPSRTHHRDSPPGTQPRRSSRADPQGFADPVSQSLARPKVKRSTHSTPAGALQPLPVAHELGPPASSVSGELPPFERGVHSRTCHPDLVSPTPRSFHHPHTRPPIPQTVTCSSVYQDLLHRHQRARGSCDETNRRETAAGTGGATHRHASLRCSRGSPRPTSEDEVYTGPSPSRRIAHKLSAGHELGRRAERNLKPRLRRWAVHEAKVTLCSKCLERYWTQTPVAASKEGATRITRPGD